MDSGGRRREERARTCSTRMAVVFVGSRVRRASLSIPSKARAESTDGRTVSGISPLLVTFGSGMTAIAAGRGGIGGSMWGDTVW